MDGAHRVQALFQVETEKKWFANIYNKGTLKETEIAFIQANLFRAQKQASLAQVLLQVKTLTQNCKETKDAIKVTKDYLQQQLGGTQDTGNIF